MAGSATFTTVESIHTTDDPRMHATSVSRLAAAVLSSTYIRTWST